MQKIVGYITSSPLQQGFVSHQLQNLLIKKTLDSYEHIFLLSWTEQKAPNNFIFENLLKENFYTGICFFSLEQVLDFPEPFKMLRYLNDRKLWIGFAKENSFFSNAEQFEKIFKTAWLMSTLRKNPAAFDLTCKKDGKFEFNQ